MKTCGARPCSLLVVDDDANLAATIRDFLQQEGYCVETALSPAEALEVQARNSRLCIALVDLVMPAMDGLELMDRLHEHDPELAVIIMTGYGTIETAVEAIKRGAEDYVTKPFDRETVRIDALVARSGGVVPVDTVGGAPGAGTRTHSEGEPPAAAIGRKVDVRSGRIPQLTDLLPVRAPLRLPDLDGAGLVERWAGEGHERREPAVGFCDDLHALRDLQPRLVRRLEPVMAIS